MSVMQGVKFLYKSRKGVVYAAVVFMDLFFWGLAGLFHTIITYDIESWAVEETFSLAWRGMFEPSAFMVGHLIGLIFYLSVRSLRNSSGITKKILEE